MYEFLYFSGLLIYFFYGVWNSNLRHEKLITSTTNSYASNLDDGYEMNATKNTWPISSIFFMENNKKCIFPSVQLKNLK